MVAAELFISLMTFACCVSAAAALLWPHPSMQVAVSNVSLSSSKAVPVESLTWSRPTSARPRRVIEIILWRIGRLLSRARRNSQEWPERPIYPHSRLSAIEFIGLKALSSMAGVVVYGVIAHELGTMNLPGVLMGAGIGYWVPVIWLRGRIRRRNHAILRLLPEVTDLLALCVGAGLDFLGAMNRVVAAKTGQREPLVEELLVVLQEIRLGKRRIEALRAMAARVNLSEVGSFVRTLVQAERMGTPIGEALAIHAEDVRMQRFLRAERQALKAPIKLLLPLVLIMFSVLILVAAPILLQFVQGSPFGQ